MRIPMLDLEREHAPYRSELREASERVLAHNQFILGDEVSAFEAALAQAAVVPHAIGVSSGTDALLLSLMALGVGAGDEVVVPAFSFFATAGVVARVGAKPVFTDICPETFNMTTSNMGMALSERTAAVLPVYLFGQKTLIDAPTRNGEEIPVIEDAAQAFGAAYGNKGLASEHLLAATSFFPTKNLGGFGDGGAVLTSDPELAERLRVFRAHGSHPKYTHHFVGGNFRLDALQAALLSVKLKSLATSLDARRNNAQTYNLMFAQCADSLSGAVKTPVEAQDAFHTYNQYVLRCDRRDELKAYLEAHGISSMIYYPSPLHLQPCFRELGFVQGAFPEAERACTEVLAIPCFPSLRRDEQAYIVEVIARFYGTVF